ncbi:hypothetical protein BH09ACT7_BH09ACT7_21580 [soil metagenome]
MSVVGCAARVGAAGFVLGLSLAVPQLLGVASAETGEASHSSSAASSTKSDSAGATQPKRSRSAPQVAASRRTSSAATSPSRVTGSPARTLRAEAVTEHAPTLANAKRTATKDLVGAQPDDSVATEYPHVTQVAKRPAEATTATVDTGPAAVKTKTVVGRLTENALPGSADPVQGLFDGVVLLIRRTFFNEAPTVTPVQITGKSEGLITGTVGAVDPEGDPIEYHLIDEPSDGAVVLHPDGTFTYTPGADFDGAADFSVAATDTGLHINLLDLSRSPSTEASVTVFQNPTGRPQVIFNFVYDDGSELWNPAARAALQATAQDLVSYIVVATPVRVTFGIYGESLPGSGTLAHANSIIYGATTFNQNVVQQKILTGVDANLASLDGSLTWNFAYPWSYDGSAGSGEYDFESVAMHELVHSLGFTSYVTAPGANYPGKYWTVFDSFIVSSNGAHPISSDGTWNNAYNATLTGGNGGLYFGGAHATATYGGLVPLYTPSSFSGSSVAHLDGFGDVMSYATPPGVAYSLSPVDLAILQDLGYTVTLQV